MYVDTLRFLDRFVGLPLCWVCTIARALAKIRRRANPCPRPRKVLIIKLSEMGSTVLAIPALLELKKRCPDGELFFFVFKNNSAILPALNLAPDANVIEIDIQSVWRLLTSGLSAMRRLLLAQIDTTIDMEFFSRLSAVLGFVVCRGNRVGFHRYTNEGLYCGDLLTHRVMYSPHVHTSVAYMSLVRTLFEKPNDEPYYRGRIALEDMVLPEYKPLPEDIESVARKLRLAGMAANGREKILLINPNSSDLLPLRKWPLHYYAELSRRLLAEVPSCWLVITGIVSEGEDARYIAEEVLDPRCIDFTGKTNFRELLALYSIASLMVTNDSGPAHFASMLQLPTVVLFGPETPRLYHPLGNKHRDLYTEFACSPCVSVYNGKKSPCDESRCLKAIPVEQVLGEVMDLLRAP